MQRAKPNIPAALVIVRVSLLPPKIGFGIFLLAGKVQTHCQRPGIFKLADPVRSRRPRAWEPQDTIAELAHPRMDFKCNWSSRFWDHLNSGLEPPIGKS